MPCSLARIYNGVLTAAQIAENYAVGSDTLVVPKPPLSIERAGGQITLSWPVEHTGFTLQSRTSLNAGAWTDVEQGSLVGERYEVTISAGAGPVFYRLIK
jgi:hypothetical protein